MNEKSTKDQQQGTNTRDIPWGLVSFAVLVAIVATFVLQNRDRMPVNFVFFEINSRQWVNLIVAVAFGVVLDRSFIGWRKRRRKDD
ncbi:MAG: hypothetical protein O3B91_03880 [Actinomycetota bacterium]|nr:hypothetical protein [Actinomycetota bacterium]MDA3020925.1 hypothetical protein [Actinomycetota bacterium]